MNAISPVLDPSQRVVLTVSSRRNDLFLMITCTRSEIPSHVRAFASEQCLPPGEISLSVVESADNQDEPSLLNFYKCDECGKPWQDVWSCACDDDCPNCGKRHISPYKSEEIQP
jgi:hypothetical protein